MADSHRFKNKTSPFVPFKILCQHRMKNTEIGHKTNINTKNNSLSVCYHVALFAWSYPLYYKCVYDTNLWETEKQNETQWLHNFMYIGMRLMPQPCVHFSKIAVIT